MALYRSNMTFESIHEANIIALVNAHGANLLPADARTGAVDDGHTVAFYSNDEWACEKVNTQIETMRNASIRDIALSPTFENSSLNMMQRQEEIKREGWGFTGFPIRLTPHHHLKFTGWERIEND